MNRRETYKDIDKWRKTKNAQKKRYYRKHRKNDYNSKKSWTVEDDKLILEHEICDVELTEILGRSLGAIQNRRCRLKKRMSDEDDI